jgi:methyl-accepting chemotaxis protein
MSFREEHAGRRQTFKVTDEVASFVGSLLPAVKHDSEAVIRGYYAEMGALPHFREFVARNGETITRMHRDYYQALFSDPFGSGYETLAEDTLHRELTAGYGARVRMATTMQLAFHLMTEIGRRHRFSGSRAVADCIRLLRFCSVDVLGAMALEQKKLRADADSRKGAVEAAISAFTETSEQTIGSVRQAAQALGESASAIAGAGAEATSGFETASDAGDRSARRAELTASQADELSSSIQDIDRQTRDGRAIAETAVAEAKAAQDTLQVLVEASRKVESVVGLISEIAAQTNLLALNATIEAARAGEAGKGFAVVASEVKSLAAQTTKATSDIAAQIREMIDATAATGGKIDDIAAAIGRASDVSAQVAAAIGRQAEATRAIAAASGATRTDSEAVKASMRQAGEAVRQTIASATRTSRLAGDLDRSAATVRESLETLVAQLRAV